MAEAVKPQVYSIAAHRGFADALVAGLVPRYADPELGLARLTLLLPSRRAVRTVTEAFIRLSGQGMLLPRMAVVGDLDLDETLGALLDPLGAGAEIPPAADPTRRWLRLAHYLREVEGDAAGQGAALLRRAFDLGWSAVLYRTALIRARQTRNRYTALDLAGDAGLLEEFATRESHSQPGAE